ncbi:MAG: TetR/AcrR family transcriptional regulator [Rhodobacter sp.]|jgi:AcrR family transcriptional regulator|nr:TetR/AcrR family transcriptional regulator [Rhodobacter sp.]
METEAPLCAVPEKPRYHHGALHDALLAAAEAELAETGLEAFSLRRVARRAGVSHAAPAHHFGDVGGLLTALAAEGFRQFIAAMTSHQARAPQDPKAQIVAAGLGYIAFATERPALFRLIFSSDRPDFGAPDLAAGSAQAYEHLSRLVGARTGGEDPVDIAAVWAMAHGLADLMAAGRMDMIRHLAPANRERAFAGILARSIPG